MVKSIAMIGSGLYLEPTEKMIGPCRLVYPELAEGLALSLPKETADLYRVKGPRTRTSNNLNTSGTPEVRRSTAKAESLQVKFQIVRD